MQNIFLRFFKGLWNMCRRPKVYEKYILKPKKLLRAPVKNCIPSFATSKNQPFLQWGNLQSRFWQIYHLDRNNIVICQVILSSVSFQNSRSKILLVLMDAKEATRNHLYLYLTWKRPFHLSIFGWQSKTCLPIGILCVSVTFGSFTVLHVSILSLPFCKTLRFRHGDHLKSCRTCKEQRGRHIMLEAGKKKRTIYQKCWDKAIGSNEIIDVTDCKLKCWFVY